VAAELTYIHLTYALAIEPAAVRRVGRPALEAPALTLARSGSPAILSKRREFL
jgi:hypothetical protein